jgi:valyl-tRNA synthetase
MSELPKTFDPAEIENRWYSYWEESGLFRPDRPDAAPFTIVMPPPNVTGSLHLGHALDNTLQDILVRRERMRGKDALWVVGTDHAGIATQMVVERNLALHQQKRTDFTREEFVEKVWAWKEESGGAITRQLRRLGASCDWAHERFTMDEGFSKAVRKVFVELWKRGLLYRDKRLVNWDPRFQTAISDLEVETKEVPGKFWTLRYPLADGSGSIEVATTRPETMLADMAVAVHPHDERYKAIVRKEVRLPITGRLIPVIADEHADPELGSGAVKITPGHDFNDFEVGKRAGIKPAEMLNMLDAQANVVQTQDGLVPQELLGLSREDARKRVVELLEGEGALVGVEDRVIPTPFGDRSGVVIEPWLTDQWYVDVKPLAERVIEATKAAKIKIVPESWAKTWFHWLENIQPWCVSRQLWWGHRIPAWYGLTKEWLSRNAHRSYGDISKDIFDGGTAETRVFVGSEEEVRAEAEQYYGSEYEILFSHSDFNVPTGSDTVARSAVVLRQDEDVLDTWFSSALWPFATLGWPDAVEQTLPLDAGGKGGGDASTGTAPLEDHPNPAPPHQAAGQSDLARHYPNDVLISGFDILFFWDARMAMQGLEFMGEVPWRTLYLHGLVRDAQGQKMSKSKGNTVDPLGLIDKYGADALRFTLAAMESQGRDIKLDEKRVEGYRNFATKLWNAARFLQMNGVGASDDIAAPAAELPVNRWIIGEVVETLAKLDRAFDELRYDEMADAIYHFVWGTFCDWYVELVKGAFDDETKRVAAWAFDQILMMLHPLMPFITEELWHANERPYDLIVAKWPEPEAQLDPAAKAEIEWLIGIVSEIRSGRSDLNVPPSARTDLLVHGDLKGAGLQVHREPRLDVEERVRRNLAALARLARIDVIEFLHAGTGIDARDGSAVDRRKYESGKRSGFQIVVSDTTYSVPVGELIDVEAEKSRLSKAVEAAERERDSLAARLSNPNFVERAKPEAVEKARADHAERAAEAERLHAALERLG